MEGLFEVLQNYRLLQRRWTRRRGSGCWPEYDFGVRSVSSCHQYESCPNLSFIVSLIVFLIFLLSWLFQAMKCRTKRNQLSWRTTRVCIIEIHLFLPIVIAVVHIYGHFFLSIIDLFYSNLTFWPHFCVNFFNLGTCIETLILTHSKGLNCTNEFLTI